MTELVLGVTSSKLLRRYIMYTGISMVRRQAREAGAREVSACGHTPSGIGTGVGGETGTVWGQSSITGQTEKQMEVCWHRGKRPP